MFTDVAKFVKGGKRIQPSPDGKYALASHNLSLELWDIVHNRRVLNLNTLTPRHKVAQFSPDGSRVFCAYGSTFVILDTSTGARLRTFEVYKQDHIITHFCLSPNGHYVIWTGYNDSLHRREWQKPPIAVFLWRVATSQYWRVFGTENLKGTPYLCPSTDGRYLLSSASNEDSSSAQEVTKIWALGLDAPFLASFVLCGVQAALDAVSLRVQFTGLLQKGCEALEGGDTRKAARYVREARSLAGYARAEDAVSQWQRLYSLLPRSGFRGAWQAAVLEEACAPVCFSPNGEYLASGLREWGEGHGLWTTDDVHCVQWFEMDRPNSVTFSPDGNYLLSAGSGRVSSGVERPCLKLSSVIDGRCLETLDPGVDVTRSVAWSADERLAGSAGWAGVALWDMHARKLVHVFKSRADHIWFSRDTRFVYAADEHTNVVTRWYVASGVLDGTWEFLGYCVHRSDAGLLVLNKDGLYEVWDFEVGRCVAKFEGEAHGFWCCCSADRRFGLSSNREALTLWDLSEKKQTLLGYSKGSYACFSPDARYVASTSIGIVEPVTLWVVDWELDDRELANWDEGARPYLENFLYIHTPYAATLPEGVQPSEAQLREALARHGKPVWNEEDFQQLLRTLGWAGYGWLREDGVRRKLEQMADQWQGPLSLDGR